MERPFPAYQGDEPYVFVSYAHADDEIVYPEITWLHDQGFNIWYDEGITPGSEWTDELAERITNASLVVFMVTPRSVESRVCQQEAQYAVKNGVPLIQVHLERTELPPGLDLTLSGIQAIIRAEYSTHDYGRKLIQSISTRLSGETSTARLQKSPNRTRLNDSSRRLLGWSISGALILGAVVLIWMVVDTRPDDDSRPPHVTDEDFGRTIVVLPFQAIADDPLTQEYAFAISQELEANFVGYPEIKVSDDELAVSYLLKGTLQRIGDTLRVVPKLQRTRDSEMIWSDAMDVDPTSPNDSAKAIGRVARMQLVNDNSVEDVRKRYRNTEAIEAYRAALLENHKWNQGGQVDIEFMVNAAKRAVELESIDEAYWVLVSGYENTGRPVEAYEVLNEGLSKHPGHPLLLHMEAWMAFRYKLDFEHARYSFKRALDENPLHPQVRWFQAGLGTVAAAEGDLKTARRHYEDALRNYDADGRLWVEYAAVLLGLGLPKQALEAAHRTLSLVNDGGIAGQAAGIALRSLVDLGEIEEARPYLKLYFDSYRQPYDYAAWPYKALGDDAKAMEILLKNKEQIPEDERSHVADALDYGVMDLPDRCIDSLIKAIRGREVWTIMWARSHPAFESARNTHRWSEVTDFFESERGIIRGWDGARL